MVRVTHEQVPPLLKSLRKTTDPAIMISITRLVRMGVRFAAWVTPHVKEWHRKRNLNQNEGQRHMDARNWSEAEHHLTAALAERNYQPMRRLELMLNLATAQRQQDKLSEAEQTARTAIDLAIRARNHAMHLVALDVLADTQLDGGHFDLANQTIAEMTRLENTQPKPDVTRLAEFEHKLGTALLRSGRKNEATEAFERAVGLAEKAFGAEHQKTADSMTELGILCRQEGNHPEAQRLLRRALAIHRKSCGTDSNEATQDLYNLAASLEESGDLRAAMQEYERVLSWKERQIGVRREEMVDIQLRVAALYVQVGKLAQARELMLHVVGILDREKGPRLVRAMETLAAVEELSGRPEEARMWREKALHAGAAAASVR